MAGAPLVEVKNLKFSYRKGENVLNNLSLTIGEGELVALTGPSGSGKSTLFYVLGCLLEKYEGEVLWSGRSLKKLSETERAFLRNQQIGFVFQQFYLLPRASVKDNILLPAYYPFENSAPNDDDKQRVLDIVKKLNIEDLLDRRPQELSGGQQQRVAIARALLRNPSIILADEPTGNLDSKSSQIVMDLLKQLNKEGHTIVIVTHSPEISSQCDRVLRMKDGVLESDERKDKVLLPPSRINKQHNQFFDGSLKGQSFLGWKALVKALPSAWSNILRSKAKSLLTMLGVSLGVAAVLCTLSLGSFAKARILEGYEALGVNTLRFTGYENWRGGNSSPIKFQQFDWNRDVFPLYEIFPEIEIISPIYSLWNPTFSFGGVSLADNTMALGVSTEYFKITGQLIEKGRRLSIFDMDAGAPVCVIGHEVALNLFPTLDPLDKQVSISQDSTVSLPCRVVGVLEKLPSSQGSIQPNRQILLPYTYFSKAMTIPWYRQLNTLLFKIESGQDPSLLGEKLEGFFKNRFGDSGRFNAGADAKLITQMKLFLNIFSGLLSAVAFIALLVGGVGINNMMLANLAERLKELGLRKSLGATPRQLRYLVLGESLMLCLGAGFVGLVVGVSAYQGLIFAATKLIDKLEYQWIFEPLAFLLSFVAIFVTGVLSGIVPAIKAEKLDVMESMRQDT